METSSYQNNNNSGGYRKMKKCILLIVTIVFISTAILVGCSSLDKNSEILSVSLNSDIHDILIGQETSVTFVAIAEGNNPPEQISLECEKKKIGEISLDKEQSNEYNAVYVGEVTVYSDIFEVQNVTATVNKIESEPISLYFYSELTEQDYFLATEINEDILTIESEYLNEDGFILPEQIETVMKDISEYIKAKFSIGEIIHYTIDDGSIYIELANHMGYLYQPTLEGMLDGGGDVRVITVEPSTDEYSTSGFQKEMGNAKESLNNASAEYLNYTLVSEIADLIYGEIGGFAGTDKSLGGYVDKTVTIENMKRLGDCDVIIWVGHGGYNSEIGSALFIGEEGRYNESSIKYSADIQHKRIHLEKGNRIKDGSTKEKEYYCSYALTGEFFKEYLSNMDNAIVYLGACASGKDNRLARSFQDKGASVFAYSDKIRGSYEIEMRTSLFATLASKKDNSSYYTLKESLDFAQSVFGKTNSYVVTKGGIKTILDFIETGEWFESYTAELLLFSSNPNEDLKSIWQRYIPITKNKFSISVQNSKGNNDVQFSLEIKKITYTSLDNLLADDEKGNRGVPRTVFYNEYETGDNIQLELPDAVYKVTMTDVNNKNNPPVIFKLEINNGHKDAVESFTVETDFDEKPIVIILNRDEDYDPDELHEIPSAPSHTQEPSSTDVNEQKEPPVLPTHTGNDTSQTAISAAMNLITDLKKDAFVTDYGEVFTDFGLLLSFGFADFNFDGVMEFVIAFQGGSNMLTYYKIYTLESSEYLETKSSGREFEGYSFNNDIKLYFDSSKNRNIFISDYYIRDGAEYGATWIEEITYTNQRVEHNTLFNIQFNGDEGEVYYYFRDGKLTETSKSDYEARSIEFFSSLREIEFNICYIIYENYSETDLESELIESLNSFSCEK